MQNKPRFYDHISGVAVGMFFFSLAVFDNELYIKLVYISAIFMCAVMGFGLLIGEVRSVRVQPPLYCYVALVAWAMATLLWVEGFDLGYSRTLSMVQIAVAMFVISHMLNANIAIRYILFFLFLAVLANYLVYKGLWAPGKTVYVGDRFVGMLGNANELSRIVILYAIVAMYLVVVDKNLLVGLIATAGLFAAAMIILATQSRTGLVVLGLVTLGAFVLMKGYVQKVIAIILAFLVVTYGVLTTDIGQQTVDKVGQRFESAVGSDGGKIDSSTAGRLAMINMAWDMFKQNPLGNGVGAFEHKYGAYAHNATMDLLANLGILGLLLWWMLYAALYIKAKGIPDRRIRYAVYLGIVAAFLFEMSDVFYAKRSGVVIITMLLVMCMLNTPRSMDRRSRKEHLAK
jgi:O-antigen ligase